MGKEPAMAHRNFSMVEYFKRLAERHVPELAFRGESLEDWEDWHERAHAKLIELLGEFPQPVDLAADTVYGIEEDGLIRERVILDTDRYMSMPCVVLKPVGMKEDRSGRAILCSHGHGPFGKEPVAGNKSSARLRENIALHNYNYGEQMARRGFLTLSPDLRVFGERSDGGSPYPGRDKCNVHFVRGMILGLYTLTLNIFDMKRAIDYLQGRPEVDPERIGMMGLSQGGTMTAFTTAVEPRIKAADVIGYMGSWRGFGIGRANFCGSQVVPGIFRYLDVADVVGLASPRPLLLEMGVQDTCFHIEHTLRASERVRQIYQAAGTADNLHIEVHPGEHAFAGGEAFDFFENHL